MLSLVLPVRDWPIDRVAACIASFRRAAPGVLDEVIVVDFGSFQPVTLDTEPGVRLLRLEATRWSLAEATNAGVLAATNDVIAKTDADILVSPDSRAGLHAAVASLRSGEYDVLLTQATDLPESLSVAVAAEAVEMGGATEGRLRPRWGQGGLTLFARAGWARIGGYDSRLTGWGEEDKDFVDRARRSGRRVGWVDRHAVRIFHMWHPPSYVRAEVARQRDANRALLKNDKSVFRPLQFLNSDPSPVTAPEVLRRSHPLVTVAIATSARTGRDRMIGEAVDSFRGQIDGDFEVVVLDNGSDDEAFQSLSDRLKKVALASSVRLERLRIASIPRARNDITAMARGRFICVADDDDLALRNRLADHLKPFAKDGLWHGSHGGWIDFDEETGRFERNTGKNRTIAALLKGTGKVSSHPSSFYRTDVMRAVPYDESIRFGSDWDLALRAGALGMRFAHTESYVTLRRFHEANVTVTGQANQVSNGQRSRARVWGMFNPKQQEAFAGAARADDCGVVCTNEISSADLLQLLPDYVGVWRLLVPFLALQDIASTPDTPSTLEATLKVVDGDATTIGSGVNQPIMFCSKPIRGCRRARALARALEGVVGQAPQVMSDRQLSIDMEQPFKWTQLALPQGTGVVISEELPSIVDALETVNRLVANSLLQAIIRIVSDFGQNGRGYYLVSAPISSIEEAKRIMKELRTRTGLKYAFGYSPGVHFAAQPPTDRHH